MNIQSYYEQDNLPPVAEDDAFRLPEITSFFGTVSANDSDPDGDELSYSVLDQPTGGTVTFVAPGIFQFEPDQGATGPFTFTYEVTDPSGATDTATVTIEQGEKNRAPEAEDDDGFCVIEGSYIHGDVSLNDSDPDGDRLCYEIKEEPEHGKVYLSTDGSFVYVAEEGFDGIVTFTYTVIDDCGNSDCATVTIEVKPRNEKPEPKKDNAIVCEDDSVLIDVLANDTDPDGDTLSIVSVEQPANGTAEIITVDGRQFIRYTPDPDFNGDEEPFSYTVSDGELTHSAEVCVHVEPKNDKPQPEKDDAVVCEDDVVVIDVLANDTDIDGDTLTIVSVEQPANGTAEIVTVDAKQFIRYTPDPDFNGDEEPFSYTVSDGTAEHTAEICVHVEPKNDKPEPEDDCFEVQEGDCCFEGNVSLNDLDPDGDALTFRLASPLNPPVGALTFREDGTFTYVADADFNGDVTFTYIASDGEHEMEATVTLKIQPVNDKPIAVDDEATTQINTPVTIDVVANDSDPDGDDLTVTMAGDDTLPLNGTVTITEDNQVIYTPDEGFVGEDTFTYTVDDGNGETASAIVKVIVTDNGGGDNQPPVAVDDSATTAVNTAVVISILDNDSDPDGDSFSLLGLTGAANGAIEANDDGTLTYTPNEGFTGTDSFTYTIEDENGAESNVATVTVTIEDDGGDNQPPVAVDDSATTAVNTAVTFSILANDSDPDGDMFMVSSLTNTANGTVDVNEDGTITYTPDQDFTGTDGFTYTIVDENGAESNVASVVITVEGPDNQPPVAVDDNATTVAGTPVTIEFLANDSDPDGDALAFVTRTAPPNGSVQLINDTFVYTPADGFTGTDSFTYVITDGEETADATVTIVVTAPENQPPVANDDTATTEANTLVTISVLDNDSDPDGDDISVSDIVGQPSNGTVVINNDGTIDYDPNDDFVGTDSFVYELTDENGATDTATVTVTIEAPENNPPVAVNDSATTEEGSSVTITVLTNDSDPDGDDFSITAVGDPGNGTVTLNNDGTLTYTPNDDFTGTDSFTYTITDENGATDTATVTVTVNEGDGGVCVDETAPVLITETSIDLGNAANRNAPLVVGGCITFEDTFTDSRDIRIRLESAPLNGILLLDGVLLDEGDTFTQADLDDGSVRYMPSNDTATTDSFGLVAIDEAGNETTEQNIDLSFGRITTTNTINGTDNADNLFGQEGVNDLILAENGNDFVTGGSGDDEIRGGLGDDTIHAHDGDDVVFGQGGDDFITGGEGDDTLLGGSGDDILDGHGGNDMIEGGDGDDRLHGNAGDDLLFGGAGEDTLEGGDGNDKILGGDGDDGMQGEGGDDILFGNDGDDKLEGNDGNDRQDGGNGDDQVIGHGGDDILFGGNGDDIVEGHDGDDILEGGAGDDFLEGHGGRDTFVFKQETGQDTIQNFNVNDDLLQIVCRDGLTTAQDVLDNAIQDGFHTIFDLGDGSTITLLFGINFQLTEANIEILS